MTIQEQYAAFLPAAEAAIAALPESHSVAFVVLAKDGRSWKQRSRRDVAADTLATAWAMGSMIAFREA